jgi:phytoene dehydrogenase-like protein
MTASGRSEVLVVGAGLAGLACAADLCAAGLSVRVLEAGDRPGGRMRTDVREGFRLDRGFQVLNTDYPQVRRRIDVRALDLHEFAAGCVLCTDTGRHLLGHPLRMADAWHAAIPGRLASAHDLARLAALCARELVTPVSRVEASTDTSARRALENAGLSAAFVDTVLRPLFAGVFFETELATSSRVLRLVCRSMLRGTIAVPAEGIGAVPLQLAAKLPAGTLQLEREVAQLTDEGVLLADGSEAAADDVVVATDPAAAEVLLPGAAKIDSVPVTTCYHVAPRAPLREPILLVDATLEVLDTIVISNAVPSAAPRGTALIATSLATDAPPPDAAIRERLAALYQADTTEWRNVATYRIERALPRMNPPWPLDRRCRIGAGRYLCGDHRATGSVQGAMAGGAQAAREVLAARG